LNAGFTGSKCGGKMTAKKILFIASIILVPLLVKTIKKKNEKDPEIAI